MHNSVWRLLCLDWERLGVEVWAFWGNSILYVERIAGGLSLKSPWKRPAAMHVVWKRGKINQNTYQGAVKRYLSCNSTTWGSLLACCRPVLMDLPCREMSETRSTSLQNRCTHNRTHMNISLFASVIFNISPIPGVWEWLPQLHAQWQICSVLLASSPTNWTNP